MFQKLQKLYIAQSDVKDPKDLCRIINTLQSNTETCISPMASKIQNDSIILSNVSLIEGTNIINTTLGRPLLGWQIIRQRAAASFYDEQDTNTSQMTLLLVSSAAVSVDILLF